MASPNEAGRLAALRRYALLGTSSEEPFDRVTRLAARWLDVPIALITLLGEDRQWFKSCVGLDRRETDREAAFCTHNLEDETLMVVADAAKDERFQDNPLVTGEPGIRFYAGAPLVTPDGYVLGSLCVIDTAPRPEGLDPEQQETLRDLSRVVMDEFELRTRHRHHEDILESITDAFFAVDEDWQFTYLNRQAEALLQRPREALLGQNVWDEFPEAKDLAFYEQYHRAVRTGESVQFEAYFPPLQTWFEVKAYPMEPGGLSVYFNDITARKEHEERLRLLSRAVEDAAEAVVVTEGAPIDEPGPRIEYVNPAFEQMTGYAAEEAVGQTPRMLQGPETDRATLDVVRSHLKAGTPLKNTTTVNYRKDGTPFWVEWNIAPVHGSGGAIEHWVSVQRDVTERRELQAALREREEYLSVTLNSIGDAVITTGPDGRITEMNDVAEGLTGWPREEAEGRPLKEIFPIHNAKTGDSVESPVEEVLRKGKTVGLANHTVLTARDGTERQIADSAAPIRTDAGELLGVVMVFRDRTEQYRQREALQEERQRLELALIGGDLGLWDLNFDTGQNVVNARWAEMLGYTLDEVGDSQAFFESHVHPDDLERAHEQMERHARGEMPYVDIEIRMRHKDGTWRWILDRGKILEWNEDGSPHRAVGTHMDITERKKAEEALRESKIALEQAQAITRTGNGIWNLEAGTFTLSEEAGRILGLDPEAEHPLDTFFNLVHPDDRALLQREFDRLEEGKPHDAEYRISPKGRDEVRWLRGRARAEHGRDERVERVLGTVADITERKETELALERSLEQNRRILRTTLDGYLLHDMEGDIVDVNPAYCDMVGYDREELTQMNVGELDTHYTGDEIVERIRSYYAEDPHRRFETTHRHKDGRHIEVEVSAGLMDSEGRRLVNAFIRDITARKQAEEALRQSEERYRTLVERSHDAIYIYRGNRLLFVNQRTCELTGYAEEELLSMDVFKLVHPNDRERVRHYARQRTEGEAPDRYEARLLRADGSVRYGEFSVQAITYQGDYAAIGSIRDVTQRREVEQALRESEQRFRDVVRAAGEYVWEIDADAVYTYVTEQAQEVKGYAPDALLGHTPYAFMLEADVDKFQRIVAEAQAKGDEFTLEHRNVTPTGAIVWERVNGTPIFDEDGAVTGFRGTGLSITERKEARRVLERREAKVQALYEAMGALTMAHTQERVAERIQALIVETLQYPISAVRFLGSDDTLKTAAVSTKTQELMPERPDYARTGKSLVARAFRSGDTAIYSDVQAEETQHNRGEVRAVAYVPIGTYGIISVGSVDVDGIAGYDVKLIEILARNAEGVLERIEREDALREARDEAEEMNRLKSAFLANMSHEIRTPLTSIIGFAEVLGEQDLGPASKFTKLIRSGGERLLETLNSVLDLSQLEAGSMELSPKSINVKSTVQTTVDLFVSKAEGKDLAIHTAMPAEPVKATLDEAALHRVLSNLLSNAVKFTDAGGRVDVRLDAQPMHLVLEVEDTGVGIDEDFVDHLFDAFQQESSGDARVYEGSGLGLTITHRLVDLMGGDIAVDTEKGRGTRFTVRLPYRMEPAGGDGADA